MRRCLVLAVTLLATSCGGSPSVEERGASDLVHGAISAMRAVASARFEMIRSGAVMTVQGLGFDSAVGRYAAPDAAEAVLRMHAGDIAVELGTISVAERTWLTNPLTGRWEELRPGSGFNPAVLFDQQRGWVALLTDLTDIVLVSRGGATHHLTAAVPPARVEALTAGLAPGQAVVIDIWLDAATLRIARLEFSTVAEEGRSDWIIVMWDFDEPVHIEPPAVG